MAAVRALHVDARAGSGMREGLGLGGPAERTVRARRRGGGLAVVLRHIRPPLASQATGTTCTLISVPAPAPSRRETYDDEVLSSAANNRTTEPRRPCSSASARRAASSRAPAQTST